MVISWIIHLSEFVESRIVDLLHSHSSEFLWGIRQPSVVFHYLYLLQYHVMYFLVLRAGSPEKRSNNNKVRKMSSIIRASREPTRVDVLDTSATSASTTASTISKSFTKTYWYVQDMLLYSKAGTHIQFCVDIRHEDILERRIFRYWMISGNSNAPAFVSNLAEKAS